MLLEQSKPSFSYDSYFCSPKKTQAQLTYLWLEADTTGSGSVGFDEFVAAFANDGQRKKELQMQRCRAAFEKFARGSGCVAEKDLGQWGALIE